MPALSGAPDKDRLTAPGPGSRVALQHNAGKTVCGMQRRCVVALYGNSLLIDIVETSLGNQHRLDVIRVSGPSGSAVENLKSLCPDMIVVDSTEPDAQFVLSFFKDRAGVPLLCLDPNHNKAMLLSCQHYNSLTTTDLTDLVHSQISGNNGRNLPSQEILLS